MKIIISSLSLANYLNDCLLNASPISENKIIISVGNNEFHITNLSKRGISCETQNKTSLIYCEIDYQQLCLMRNLFKIVGDQPVTLGIDERISVLYLDF